jgi:ABC-type glycerol-3-phosphate transport system substrate-binding protein
LRTLTEHPSKKHRLRRASVIVGSVLASVAAISAAGLTSASASSNVQLTIWAINNSGPIGTGPVPAGWDAITKAYEKQDPGITINWKYYTAAQNPSSYQTLLTAIAGGNSPDIAEIDRFIAYEFQEKGAIEPIQPYLSSNSVVYPETDVIPGAKFEQTINGQLYGVTFPWQAVGFWSLCYNKSIFANAHLSPPTTWAEVVTDAKALTTTKNGRYLQLGYEPYPNDDTEMWYYAQPHPTPLISTNDQKAELANANGVAAVNQFVNIMNAEGGYANVSKFANPSNTLPSLDPFYTGHAAMTDCGDWYLQTIAEYYPKLPVGVVALPSPNGGKPWGWAGGWSFQLVKGSKNPKQAAGFLQFLMSKQATQIFETAYTSYDSSHHLPNVIIGAVTFMYPSIVNTDEASLKAQSPDLYTALQHFLTVPQTYAGVNVRPHTTVGGDLFTDFNNAGIAAALHEGSAGKELAQQNTLLQQVIDAQ